MTLEHRLAFTLYNASAFESEAIRSLFEKQDIPKKAHEYCRRLVTVGVTVLDVFSKFGRSIDQIESAIKASNASRCSSEDFMLRLTVANSEDLSSPESRIWRRVLDLHRTTARKEYLRKLLLYGYWFESLPQRDENELKDIFASNTHKSDVTLKEHKESNSTQSKLGGLMPSC